MNGGAYYHSADNKILTNVAYSEVSASGGSGPEEGRASFSSGSEAMAGGSGQSGGSESLMTDWR